jgi:rubrerythrin
MNIRKIYEYALQREYEGKRFFEENAGRMQAAAAVDAFRKLAAEEQKHIEFVQRQIDLLDQGGVLQTSPDPGQADTGFFSGRAESEAIQQTVSEAMVADLPVLRMAYLIERDFAEFYESAAVKAEGEAKKVLETLAYWERRHEALFKEMHDKAFEAYSEMPWGG